MFLKEKISKDLVVAAGVWDGLSARLASNAGYDSFFVSGFAVAASLGLPDADIYSKADVLHATRVVRRAVEGQIIADMDDGYGNGVNVHYNVREFEAAGADAFFIEDQVAPKRCPLSVSQVPELISTEEASGKIRAAAAGRSNPETLIIARTDAGATEIARRAEAYALAGAEAILPLAMDEAFDLDHWAELGRSTGLPLVALLTPSTWLEREMTPEVARQVGVRIIIHPLQSVYAASGAMRSTFERMRSGEPLPEVSETAMKHQDFIEMIGFPEVERLQKLFVPLVGR